MSKLNKNLKLIVEGGTIRAIYDDALIPLLDVADTVVTKRASHVEPSMVAAVGWCADLSPVGGPKLTYKTRAEALGAEVRWLNRNVII